MRPIEIEDTPLEVGVSVVMDRSGSMLNNCTETIQCYNNYINGLKEDLTGSYLISLTLFWGDGTTQILYANKPIKDVPALTKADYTPNGGTPLNDAIGKTIQAVDATRDGRPTIMVVITDGEENTSRAFSSSQIKALISAKTEEGWTFVFLGADVDSFSVSQPLGFSPKNVANYNKANTMYAADALRGSTMAYTFSRSAKVKEAKIGGMAVTDSLLKQDADESFFSADQRDALIDPEKAMTSADPLEAGALYAREVGDSLICVVPLTFSRGRVTISHGPDKFTWIDDNW